jgi:hypothetical protein
MPITAMSGPSASGDTAAAVNNIPLTMAELAAAAKNPAPVGGISTQYVTPATSLITSCGNMSPCLPCCD